MYRFSHKRRLNIFLVKPCKCEIKVTAKVTWRRSLLNLRSLMCEKQLEKRLLRKGKLKERNNVKGVLNVFNTTCFIFFLIFWSLSNIKVTRSWNNVPDGNIWHSALGSQNGRRNCLFKFSRIKILVKKKHVTTGAFAENDKDYTKKLFPFESTRDIWSRNGELFDIFSKWNSLTVSKWR